MAVSDGAPKMDAPPRTVGRLRPPEKSSPRSLVRRLEPDPQPEMPVTSARARRLGEGVSRSAAPASHLVDAVFGNRTIFFTGTPYAR